LPHIEGGGKAAFRTDEAGGIGWNLQGRRVGNILIFLLIILVGPEKHKKICKSSRKREKKMVKFAKKRASGKDFLQNEALINEHEVQGYLPDRIAEADGPET
jgi:hypothetical protein